MNFLNDKLKLEKTGMTQNELDELRYHYVDRYVDNMSTKDLVQYVFDDLLNYVDNQPDAEFLDEAQNYWEDHFDDVVKDIKEYANSDIKNLLEDREASNFLLILTIQERKILMKQITFSDKQFYDLLQFTSEYM